MAGKGKKRKAKIPPLCVALVVCDGTFREESTGKRSLMGLFSEIRAGSFPCRHPKLSVYAALTDAIGELEISIKLVQVQSALPDKVLINAKGPLVFAERRTVYEMVFDWEGLVFPSEGEYRFVLESEGRILMERKFAAIQRAGG